MQGSPDAAAGPARPRELSPRWRALFRVEVPICAGTVVYWLLAPEHYLGQLFGDLPVDSGHRYLVLQAASTVGTLLVWFYGRVLFAPEIELRTFRYLQEGMALGDAGILALSAWLALVARPDPTTLLAQVLLAAFWGAVRVVFLWSHREPGAGS